ncbi:MAG: hypothetical protein ACTHOR_01830 [Devosia sp.]
MPKSSEIEGLSPKQLAYLVERLRANRGLYICDKAASAIERLISERDEAREALRRIASRNFIYMTNSGSDNPDADAARALYREWKAIVEIARAALSPKPAKSDGE